jgi:hypothetical protein
MSAVYKRQTVIFLSYLFCEEIQHNLLFPTVSTLIALSVRNTKTQTLLKSGFHIYFYFEF